MNQKHQPLSFVQPVDVFFFKLGDTFFYWITLPPDLKYWDFKKKGWGFAQHYHKIELNLISNSPHESVPPNWYGLMKTV